MSMIFPGQEITHLESADFSKFTRAVRIRCCKSL